ncbi:MAG: radical SAM protein [Candidatus Jettenia caeni]|nr:radical SAM protein [Candidatus Jettenia caeni]
MKVLLLSSPYISGYMRNARCDFVSLSGTQWYPILLGYCGAWLEKCGYQVKLVDAPAYNLDHKTTEKMVTDYKPDWLIVYTGRISEDNDIALADRLTEKIGCEPILVGPYASIFPKETLRKTRSIRRLITGEFELPVQDVIEGKADKDIPNLVYKEGDDVIQNPERPYLNTEQLNQIPFLSRFFKRHLHIYRYKTISEPYPFMDIMTGRGCKWGHCTYCLWVNSYIKGSTYNCRSIDNVIEELWFISKEMPEIRSLMLQDDTFTEERIIEFCEAKLKTGIKLSWSCYARGDIAYDVLKLMKKANCLNLHVGFESADKSILSTIKKGVTKDRMTRFALDAKRVGLRIHGDFGIGFPDETRESIHETVDWACEIRPHTVQFQLMIPFPGTPFYAELKEKGWIKNGAPNYPELSMKELESLAKRAYRRFYISLPFAKQVLRNPYEMLFSRIETYCRAIPAVFWKRYIR